MRKQNIKSFLDEIKKNGKSSPYGMHWNEFFKFLKNYKKQNETDPPLPLILAATGESKALKHHRLSMQLEWAEGHNCLDEAILFLKELQTEKWI